MSDKIDIAELKERVDIVAVISKFVDLKLVRGHWVGCCPFHNEDTPSFKVTPKKNIYKCFGCGKSGDVIQFLIDNGRTFQEAVKELADPNNISGIGIGVEKTPAKKQKQSAVWRQIVPAVETENMFVHYAHGMASAWWAYHDQNGNLFGYVCRFDLPDGKKEVLPYIYATDGTSKKWIWKGFEKPKPLFGLGILEKQATKTVLMVEGEKTALKARELFPKTNVTTWAGGSKAIKKDIDFSVLKGRVVVFWPDNDQPGFDAMLEINDIIKGYCTTRWVVNPQDAPKGWDIADSDWTPEEAKAYTSQNTISVPDRDMLGATWKVPVVKAIELPVINIADLGAEIDEEEDRIAAVVYDSVVAEKKKKAAPVVKLAKHTPLPPLPPVDDDEGAAYPLRGSEFFRILGAKKEGNGMLYNFYSKSSKTVIALSPGSMTRNNLMQLAPLNWWQNTFPDSKASFCLEEAVDYLIHKSSQRGVFNHKWIRGRGAWVDDKRIVVHAGDRLFVDGAQTSLDEYTSKYIYEVGEEMGFNLTAPVGIDKGTRLIEMLKLINWDRAVSAYLLAGWCVVAPVCGALSWRPHVWLTGAAGTGKTTILKNIVKPLLGETGLFLEGETTAAGIRQMLKNDALPVVFEEAEGEDKQAQERMKPVMSLMRSSSSSSGNVIAKGSSGGSANVFEVKSCFLFASIVIQTSQHSDIGRVTPLGILKSTAPDAADKFQEFLKIQGNLMTESFSRGLLSRTVGMLPTILENIKTFSRAAALSIGEQRAGDQIGALLAGAYSLESNDIISFDEAVKWVSDKDWGEEKANDQMRDEIRLISHLLEQTMHIDGVYKAHDRSIGEVVQVAMNLRVEWDFVPDKANDRLKRSGMKVTGDWLYISNSDNQIHRLLYNTPWANNHNKVLMRLPGAESVDSCRFASGITTRAVRLSKELLFKDFEIVHIEKELTEDEKIGKILANDGKQVPMGIDNNDDWEASTGVHM